MADILEPEQRELLQRLVDAWCRDRVEFRTGTTIPMFWNETKLEHPQLDNGPLRVSKHDLDTLIRVGFLQISKQPMQGIGDDMTRTKFVVTNLGIEYLDNWKETQRQLARDQSRWRRMGKKLWDLTNHQVVGGLVLWILIPILVIVIAIVLGIYNSWWELGS